jgi:uncharacterized protein (DUF362 family)
MINPRRVAVIRQEPRYEMGRVRASVRQVLEALGFTWSELIRPGDRVLLKPNFVRESHLDRPEEWEQIITHGSVIAAVAFEVAEALGGTGTITIADSPQTDSNFDLIRSRTGLSALQERLQRDYPGVKVEILDLRREYWRTEHGVVVERRKVPDDPRGYTLVDLGERSSFHRKKGIFYGADYDTAFTAMHHSNGHHEYLLARSAVDADVFINLPKLKTHKKVGVTLSLKNLVGINGDKNYLPHFCIGTPAEGGDEFPRSDAATKLQSRLISTFKRAAKMSGAAAKIWAPIAVRLGASVFGATNKVVRSGNWHGNDTTWRMTLDLNRCLFHFDGAAQIRRTPLRYLTIIDGIIAGEGNGPMEADAKRCGVLVAGTNPVAADLVATELMGFDWRKISTIREAFSLSTLPLVDFSPEQIEVVPQLGERFHFKPHFGWVGHVEAEQEGGAAKPEKVIAS